MYSQNLEDDPILFVLMNWCYLRWKFWIIEGINKGAKKKEGRIMLWGVERGEV